MTYPERSCGTCSHFSLCYYQRQIEEVFEKLRVMSLDYDKLREWVYFFGKICGAYEFNQREYDDIQSSKPKGHE